MRRRRAKKERRARVLVLASIVLILLTTSFISTTYTREAIVERVTTECVVLRDTCGNLWEYDTVDVVEGQRVKLIMNTNLTDNDVTDDIITKIKPMPIG